MREREREKKEDRSFGINLYSFKYKPGTRQSWDKGRRNKSTDFHQEVTLRQRPPRAAKKIRPTRSVIGTADNYLFSTNHRETGLSFPPLVPRGLLDTHPACPWHFLRHCRRIVLRPPRIKFHARRASIVLRHIASLSPVSGDKDVD